MLLWIQTASALPGAYLRVADVSVTSRVIANEVFTLRVLVEWSSVSSFVPPPYVIRVEVCAAGSSDLTTCRGLAFAPSEDGEKVENTGSKTYSIEIRAPERAGTWRLIAIAELRAIKTHSTLHGLWKESSSWVMITWGGVEPWQAFDVQVEPAHSTLTLHTEPSIQGLAILIDGRSVSTDESGTIRIEGSLLDSHVVEVPAEATIAPGAKIVFIEWSDGQTSNSRPVILARDMTLTAKYRREYFLTVFSDRGDPKGAGWYDEGTLATFSVTSPLPLEGLMGMLGGKYVLDRWSADSNAVTATTSLRMDGPKFVKAEWRVDNTMPYVMIGSAVLTITIIVMLLFLWVARTKSKAETKRRPRECANCHHMNPPYAQNYCVRCGSRLE
jgi:hypothetical protein